MDVIERPEAFEVKTDTKVDEALKALVIEMNNENIPHIYIMQYCEISDQQLYEILNNTN